MYEEVNEHRFYQITQTWYHHVNLQNKSLNGENGESGADSLSKDGEIFIMYSLPTISEELVMEGANMMAQWNLTWLAPHDSFSKVFLGWLALEINIE